MHLCALWLSLFYLVTANNSCVHKTELKNILEHSKTFSEEYLKSISDKLSKYSNALFTSQADSIVSAFEQEFGVEIVLQSPFLGCASQSCFSVSIVLDVGNFFLQSFPFTIPQSGIIESISIGSLIGTVNPIKKSMSMELDYPFILVSLQPPLSPPGMVEVPSCEVPILSFNLGFSDSATTPLNCSETNSGIIFQPTNPFSQFTGVQAQGEWNLIMYTTNGGDLESFIINYCLASACAYSSDIARSNSNIPGYRYDSSNGIAYYTRIFRNSQGEQLYATISRIKQF